MNVLTYLYWSHVLNWSKNCYVTKVYQISTIEVMILKHKYIILLPNSIIK